MLNISLYGTKDEQGVEVLLKAELNDIENQFLKDELITDNLSSHEMLVYKIFTTQVKQKLEEHFNTHRSISKEELKTIVWQELKQFSIRSGTSFTLLTSYIGLNILYAWGVAQIPYPAITTTLYTFQTILGLALSAPILTPVVSYLRRRAFNFREFEKSTALDAEDLERQWHCTSREYSLNAQISRIVVTDFLLLLRSYRNTIEIMRVTGELEDINELAQTLALFLVNIKKNFSDLNFDSPLISAEVQNFILRIKYVYSLRDCEYLFTTIESKVLAITKNSEKKDKIMPHMMVLKNYCDA